MLSLLVPVLLCDIENFPDGGFAKCLTPPNNRTSGDKVRAGAIDSLHEINDLEERALVEYRHTDSQFLSIPRPQYTCDVSLAAQ